MKNITKSLSFIAALGFTFQAGAVSFDFYKLDTNGSGASDFLPEPGHFWEGGDAVSSDIVAGDFNGSLVYKAGDLTATLTAFYKDGNGVYQEAAVVADRTKDWTYSHSAGVGVYDPENGHAISNINRSDDNITLGEKLVLSFNKAVTVTGFGLRAEQHNYTNWIDDATFLLDGTEFTLPKGTGMLDGNFTGQVFEFEYGGSNPDQFYLASAEASVSVPDAGSTLALLGFGILALVGFRKHFSR